MTKNGSVKIGDTDMYYASFGSGSRFLIALPGLSDGLATVKGMAWFLAPSYKRFLKDYTVYMFSRKNDMPDGYTVRDMAEDQVLAMRELGIDKACILGVSQGGMIAQCIAIYHPEVVDKLILAVTAPYANDIVTQTVSRWIDMAKRGDHDGLMADTAERSYSETFLRKNRKYLPVLAKFTRPKSYDRFYKDAYAILGFDEREGSSRIACPTLVIGGSDDKVVGSEAARQLSDAIAGSELYVYEGLGHGAYEEAKDFYDRVLEFCGRG